MTTFKTIAIVCFMSLLSADVAWAGNKTAGPIKTVQDLKSDVVTSLQTLELDKLNLGDATVYVEFIVNKEGATGH